MIWSFKEVFSVEASLRKKIITAINAKYITDLRNCNTNSIKKTIDVILKNLFDTYGKITPQILTQRADVVKHMTFDVDTPTDTVFNGVEELGDIATAALNPYTDKKYLNLAYNILNKTG